jgi:hypothetical protein
MAIVLVCVAPNAAAPTNTCEWKYFSNPKRLELQNCNCPEAGRNKCVMPPLDPTQPDGTIVYSECSEGPA